MALKDIKRPDLTFDEVVGAIVNFLEPIWSDIVNEEEFFGTWDKNQNEWMKLTR